MTSLRQQAREEARHARISQEIKRMQPFSPTTRRTAMPFKIASMVGGGIVGFLFFIAIVWFISALFWGGVAFLVWNDAGLYHAFHGAGTINYFWESVGIGAALSLVLG